jgi:hypothetical protein
MKNLIHVTFSCVIALFITLSFSTKCAAQSSIMAEQYAHSTAEKMMRSYCPASGTDASAYISKAEYDYSNDRYIIKMTATWSGKPCWLCDSGTFRMEGILQVNRNGSNASFNPTYKNSFVKDQEFYSNMTKGVIAVGLVATASSSK